MSTTITITVHVCSFVFIIIHCLSIYVTGIIRLYLCFIQPLIVLTLNKDDPKATVLQSVEKSLANDPKFIERVKVQSLKLIYEYIQDKHIKLLLCFPSQRVSYSTIPGVFCKDYPNHSFE